MEERTYYCLHCPQCGKYAESGGAQTVEFRCPANIPRTGWGYRTVLDLAAGKVTISQPVRTGWEPRPDLICGMAVVCSYRLATASLRELLNVPEGYEIIEQDDEDLDDYVDYDRRVTLRFTADVAAHEAYKAAEAHDLEQHNKGERIARLRAELAKLEAEQEEQGVEVSSHE